MGRKARTRISRAYDVDLAFDPTEPRDTHGRWGHGGVATLEKETRAAALDAPAEIEGDESLYHAQTMAQSKCAAHWQQATGSDDFWSSAESVISMKPSPERSWAIYQLEGGYQAINGELRDGEGILSHIPVTEPVPSLTKNMLKAFDTMGYKTKQDGNLFRMVDADKVHIGDVGSVFTDKGVSSTAARTDDIASLLDPPGQGQAPLDHGNPVLLQIRVPKGSNILGGAYGGIETMLPPGSKFKVVSKPGSATIGGADPEPGSNFPRTGKHTLPTIVLELQP